MAKKSRKSPPKFLKGKLIQNNRYTRHDALSLAKDNIVLGLDSKLSELDESIVNAEEYLKAKKK